MISLLISNVENRYLSNLDFFFYEFRKKYYTQRHYTTNAFFKIKLI